MRSQVSLFIDLQPTFNEARCKAPVRLASVETFRKFVQTNYSEVAIVFASEGNYNNGSFTFNYEHSNKFPLQLTKELCFKLNKLIFGEDRVFAQELDKRLSSEMGRRVLLGILHSITNDDEGGTKVPRPVTPPVNPSPTGIKVEQPNEAEA